MLRARLLDVALALACVVAGQVEIRHHGSDGYTGGPMWLNTVALLAFGVAVVGWRVAPGVALVWMSLVIAVPSLFTAHDAFFWTVILPLLLVTYRNARSGDGRLARYGWLLGVAAMLSAALHFGALVGNLATIGLVLGGGSLAGRLVRRTEQQRDRLDQALADLEESRSERERVAALAERNRIATEMHDVVAHAVTEMVVQLGAARMGLQAGRLGVPSQLTAAEATGRQALTDLRRSLGLLVEHPEHGLAPVPGLTEVDALVAGFRDAGLEVVVHRYGDTWTRVPTGLQLSVHRVLQEALTNALKHAGPVAVEVHLRQERDDLDLVVVNQPPAPGREHLPSGRHGLVGMRERVGVYGGALDAGPTADGGWRVHARWPVPAEVLV